MSKKVRLFATQRVTRKAKNGKDALQIIVEPDTLVFDTDENGLVNNSELSGKYAEIRCYRGNTDVTDLCRFFYEDGDNINCNANVLVNRVSFTKINTQTIEGNEVSFSNGYVNITIKDESLNSHSVQIKFSVNITKFIGGQISNNKKFESKYAKLTAGMSEGSSIIQTAQNISLEVTKSSLKKAGIEITTDQVKLYGDKVQVLTRKDGETNYEQAGMFSNGKLNANLIDAETIVVNGLQANGIQGNTIDAKNATISNLKVKNVIVSGSLRSPFLKVSDSFDSNYSDNAVMQVENDGWPVVYSIPWNVEQAGRKICILSNLWGGKQITGGSVSISVPEAAKNAGCRFYENGIAKTELHFSTEVLELIAYGNISAKKENEPKTHYLYGWIVLNRIDLMTVRKFGKEKKVLAYGKVTGTTSGASIQYNTFDGSEMSVSRISTGKYKIHIDAEWVTSADKLFVILTNLSRFTSRGVSLMDIEKATTGFDIRVLTSAMQNNADGDFNFEISNFDDFAI